MIIMDAMNFAMGKLMAERRLWADSHNREIQMVDEILRPGSGSASPKAFPPGRCSITNLRRRCWRMSHSGAGNTPGGASGAVCPSSRAIPWKLGPHGPAGAQAERAVPRREPRREPGEREQAWRLRRWALLVLLDEYTHETGNPRSISLSNRPEFVREAHKQPFYRLEADFLPYPGLEKPLNVKPQAAGPAPFRAGFSFLPFPILSILNYRRR